MSSRHWHPQVPTQAVDADPERRQQILFQNLAWMDRRPPASISVVVHHFDLLSWLRLVGRLERWLDQAGDAVGDDAQVCLGQVREHDYRQAVVDVAGDAGLESLP